MKIVLYGNFSVDYCSEVHHAKSLEALGHTVIRLQETTVPTEVVLSESLAADALVWIHSHGFINKGSLSMGHVLDMLRTKNIPTIAYHLDLYMGLERWKEYEHSEYFKVQHFFTVDRLMADWLNRNTATKGHYLAAGVYHEEAYLLFAEPIRNDVIFVGSKGYHPEWPYRPKLVQWLQDVYGNQFKHYGNDGLGVVRGSELNKLYASSKVVVGDTLCPGFNYPDYFSDRVFETTGRGGFIIHPYIEGIGKYFNLGKEIVTYRYNDFDGLRGMIDYYLDHDKEREEIRMAGNRRTTSDHTYLNRWEYILKKVSHA